MEQAAALELLHRNAAIEAAMSKPEKRSARFDGKHCIEEECGEEIPAGRLALGKVRCLDCQVRKEKRDAH